MFKRSLGFLPFRNVDLNVYVTGVFLVLVSVVLYISTSASQVVKINDMTVSPISGFEQKVANLSGTKYNLTSRTAIIKSQGSGSYLFTLKSPPCAANNYSILSTFPVLSSNRLIQQTEKSWLFESRNPDSDNYLVIQTTGLLCQEQNDNSPTLMDLDLIIPNK